MDPKTRAELREMLAKATVGPWGVVGRHGVPTIAVVDPDGNQAPRTGMRPAGDPYPVVARMPTDYAPQYADIALIVALRNNAEALLDALDAAERKLAMREITAIGEIQDENERLATVEREREQTTAGAVVPTAQPAGAAIGELRRLSGLTWDQLARIFSVSRRSLHFWASGKPMAPSNEEHLQRVLAVVRKIDRGAASANRTALLGVRENGSIPFDLLVAGEYEGFVSLLGPGEARRVAPPKLSEEARAARAPRPPEELVGALQDRVHREPGALRAAKSVRVRSGR